MTSIKTEFFKDHYLTMSNIDSTDYYNIKFQEKPLIFDLDISINIIYWRIFKVVTEIQKTIKIVTSIM